MKQQDFVHLHCHSDYSLIDGAAKTKALAEQAKRSGHIALALTDHGSVSGIIDHWKACEKNGVKPIIGCEAYLAPGLDDLAHTRRGIDADGNAILNEKGKKKSFDYSHFTLLAKNEVGWKNLQRLATIASLDGFYYRPRMSWALLTKYHEGLIALSGCLSGQPAREIRKGNDAAAEAHARRWLSLFGSDYYMEMMPSGQIPEQVIVNDRCLAIAKRLGIKPVATGDVHYVDPSEADVQEVKICVNAYKTLAENRSSGLCMPATFYYKSTEEMYREFSQLPEAILNTREIADKCEKIKVLPGKFFMPKFRPPTGETPVDYFRRLAREGLFGRYGVPTEEQSRRLEYELACIEKLGFVDYFLVVHDLIAWARNNGVYVGPGRGSAAGSCVSYCLWITNIDPLRYDLLFERFLNPDRVSLPDIDIDFNETGRGRVIEYVKQKYGEKAVAQIVTFGESKAKSAVKDVARVLDVSQQDVNRLTKMIPEGPKVELKESLETIPELAAAYQDPRNKRLFDLALGLEGLYRNCGRHAAGIVIGDTDLIERVPLMRVGKGEDAGICTAFSMERVEDIGLVKMDFLGLKTLDLIHDTLDLIEETTGKRIEEDRIPMRDAHSMLETTGKYRCWIHEVPFSVCRCCDKTLKVLCTAETNGVFQVESSGMKKLLKQMKPDRFDDIIALVALFRPGPLGSGMDQTYVRRKNGEEPVEYEHPSLKTITHKTYGVWCFQEQLMQLSVALAGFTLPQADELRKATAKKKPEAMAKIKDKFIPGCVKHVGMPLEQATAIWEKIVYFSEYSFNCITRDSEVVCADTGEVVTVESLATSGCKPLVHALGDDFKVRRRRVKRVWSTGKQAVFELDTASHRKVKATGKHRFRTLGGWKELADLRPGDMIAVAREMETTGDLSMKHHEIVVLAGLLSEGNTCHPSTLYFTNKDSPKYIDEFETCAAVFDDTVVRREHGKCGKVNIVANMGAGSQHRHGERSGIFLWAKSLGLLGKNATQKEIPACVFRLNKADLAKFMGRLWTGDGYLSWTKMPGSAAPFFASSSLVMARQVHVLLSRLGISSTFHAKLFKYRYKQTGARKRPDRGVVKTGEDAKGSYELLSGYTINLVGRLALERFGELVVPEIVGYDIQKKRFAQHVEAFGDDATRDGVPASVRSVVSDARDSAGMTWDELEAKSGVSVKEMYRKASQKKMFGRHTVDAVASVLPDVKLQNIAGRDVFWDTVKSITPVGIQDTYDMEVEGDHNFAVNNGIIAHNCSHSAAYGLIGWETAWLKANYPVEFMAALMTCWSGVTDDLARYVEEVRRWGVPVEPPDINEGVAKFKVRVGPDGTKSIIYGLEALKGISVDTVNAIIAARKRVGRFRSFLHFAENVDPKIVTTGVTETLAKAGAFLSTGVKRSQLLEPVDRTISSKKTSKVVTESAIATSVRLGKAVQKDAAKGQGLLFTQEFTDEEEERVVGELLPAISEWKPSQILAAEKESLGLYLSGHPLDEYAETLREYVSALSVRSGHTQSVEAVVMGGVVRSLRRTLDRSGGEMAFATVEDVAGTIDAVFFGKAWQENQPKIATGRVLFFRGKLDRERDPPSLRVEKVIPLDQAAFDTDLAGSSGVMIRLFRERVKPPQVQKIREIMDKNPGPYSAFYQMISCQTGEVFIEQRYPTMIDGSPLIRRDIADVLQDAGSVERFTY